jgi:hypothetical protein
MDNPPSSSYHAFFLLIPDVWEYILGMLNIKESRAICIADPRTFGALIEHQQSIRFKNAFNSPSTIFHDILGGTQVSSYLKLYKISTLPFYNSYSLFLPWLKRQLLKTSIVPRKLFANVSSIIALKDRGFVSSSWIASKYRGSVAYSILSDRTIKLKSKDESCSITWNLLYRASLFGYDEKEFRRTCNSKGSCVVVVKAENGRIAAAYNEDGFADHNRNGRYSDTAYDTPNRNGFIVSIKEDGSCGEIYHRTVDEQGVRNYNYWGPTFGARDLSISSNYISSSLGQSYFGRGPDVNENALFGDHRVRVLDYEVFKIGIE